MTEKLLIQKESLIKYLKPISILSSRSPFIIGYFAENVIGSVSVIVLYESAS